MLLPSILRYRNIYYPAAAIAITTMYGAMNEYLGLADLKPDEAQQLWHTRDWLHRFTACHSTAGRAQDADGPSFGVLIGDAWRAAFEGKYFTSIKFYDSFIQSQDKIRMLHFTGKIMI